VPALIGGPATLSTLAAGFRTQLDEQQRAHERAAEQTRVDHALAMSALQGEVLSARSATEAAQHDAQHSTASLHRAETELHSVRQCAAQLQAERDRTCDSSRNATLRTNRWRL
jgi:hypothetical protein